jgi:ABC-type transport system substrate-binding protein
LKPFPLEGSPDMSFYRKSTSLWIACLLLLAGCERVSLNNPYPAREEGKNILYSSFGERPKHLDPAQSYSSNEIVFTAQIYEPPFQYHYLKRPYTLIPQTAVSLPTPTYLDANYKLLPEDAPSGKIAFSQYDIQILPGIYYQPHPAFAKERSGEFRYHHLTDQQLREIDRLSDFNQTDSRELTAADYVYEIKRLAHPKIHSPIYGSMTDYIVGLREFGARLQEASLKQAPGDFLDLRRFPLAGAETMDRYRYRITIHGKYPQFIYWLAMPFFAPIPWEADSFYTQRGLLDKNITLDWYPIGTGPYMLTVNNPSRQMILVKNPNFHGELYPEEGEPGDTNEALLTNAGEPLPFIDQAIYNLEKEDIPTWNKFLQGYYDASGISSDSFDQAIRMDPSGDAGLTDEMKARGIRLLTGASPTTYYMGFNMLDSVVGGYTESAQKLRQAIAIAIDQEDAIEIFQNGRGLAMQGPLPPGIFGYRDGALGINPYVYTLTNGRPKRKPIAEAKRLLTEAGYPNGRHSGKPLILYFDTTGTSPDDKAHYDWFRKQFEKIDIELVIRSTDYNRFQDKMLKGTAQLFQWGWHADYPDPENFLFLLYGPNAKVGKNGENATNYANPSFDLLFDQMRNTENGEARQALIDRMVDIIRKDTPWASGFHPKSFGLYHRWYGNVKPNHMAYNTLKYVKLDPSMRGEMRRAWNQPVWWPIWVLGAVSVAGIVPAWVLYRRREVEVVKVSPSFPKRG